MGEPDNGGDENSEERPEVRWKKKGEASDAAPSSKEIWKDRIRLSDAGRAGGADETSVAIGRALAGEPDPDTRLPTGDRAGLTDTGTQGGAEGIKESP